VQFLPAITRRLVVNDFAGCLAGLGDGGRFAFALGLLARGQFRHAARFFLCGSLANFFVGAPAALFLEALAVQALLFQSLGFGALERGFRLLLGFAQLVYLLLLQAGCI